MTRGRLIIHLSVCDETRREECNGRETVVCLAGEDRREEMVMFGLRIRGKGLVDGREFEVEGFLGGRNLEVNRLLDECGL